MNFKLALLPLLATLMLKPAICAPGDVSFVVSSKESTSSKETTHDVKNNSPIIYEMNINSNVSNRFAKTLIQSKVRNADTTAKEATFSVVIPEKAFISEFVMEIGGKSYKAYVKEKEEAKNIYNAAVSSGQSAAHVAVGARDSNRFTVSLNIEAEAKASFLLTYEELLERKNDQYELVLNIHPGQIVKDLNVQVNINETRPLVFVKTPSLRFGDEISKSDDKVDPSSSIYITDIDIINQTSAVVKFKPNDEQQKQFAKQLGGKESEGLAGQFIVQYEVERDPHGGEVLIQDGFFVHFFAPQDAKPLPKHVYFILDTSYSMMGLKIKHLKDAMISILDEIKPEDTLSIAEFNTETFVWNIEAESSFRLVHGNYSDPFPELSKQDMPRSVPATKKNIYKAKKLVNNKLRASGETNLIGALEAGLYMVKSEVERSSGAQNRKQPIIIFLTDGEPNLGLLYTDTITEIVTRLNHQEIEVPIFSLSFGEDAQKEFLKKLSLNNMGFSRHIYDAADASLQLQDFYKEISSPLLSNVNFKYDSGVKEVTRTHYPILFRGSEMVVAGRYENSKLDANVNAMGPKGPLILRPKMETPVTSLERLWAYLTIKQTLEKRETVDNKTELTKKALDLALKYSFVTDVSSLVVVKPNATNAGYTEDASNALEDRKLAYYIHPITIKLEYYVPIPIAVDSLPNCEPNEYQCSNEKCVLITWRCDSEDDCGDRSDEENCGTNSSSSICQYNQFACHSNKQCIPKSHHCDMQEDCIDGSDELNCSKPVISRPPSQNVTLNVEERFEISCTAVGIPTPEIVWRLNMGHVPSKCRQTSNGGMGTLVCENIQIEEQGDYSCEAINIKGDTFAVFDTNLNVKQEKSK